MPKAVSSLKRPLEQVDNPNQSYTEMRCLMEQGYLCLVPWHVADVIERGDMRRRRDVGQRIGRTGQPGAPVCQPADIVEVMVDVLLAGTDGGRIGRTGYERTELWVS